jgi:transcriptional regulator with XRE-family HTH domain
MYINKNLVYLRHKHNISQQKMADDLGYKRSVYKNYEYTQEPDIDFLIKVSNFFKISIDELVKKDLETNETIYPNTEPSGDKLKILAITVNDEGKENIQFIPESAKAGYLVGYANPNFIGSLPSFRLPNLPTGTYRAFEIKGDSMPPISEKSIVIGKYVESISYIKNLETYIIVTKQDGIVYKRVINKTKESNKIILMSDNPAYPPYTLATDQIMEIWAYHCHIDFGANQNINKAMLQKLLDMSDEIENLDSKLSKYID